MQTIRKARVEDIDSIKAILFKALKEHQIAIPKNYPAIDSLCRKFKFVSILVFLTALQK
jgi:N-acetylglutamate synthase-like GNAT family acetyltransferase